MLDLTRVFRDLESPTYGALAHAVDILMRVIDAQAALALTWDKPSQIEQVYLGLQGIKLTSDQYRQLRYWPTDPHSKLWQQLKTTAHQDPRLFAPDYPRDAQICEELSRATAFPQARIDPTSLCVSLSSKPNCRLLFLRCLGKSPFMHKDIDRLSRFTPQATELIQQAHRRELQRLGRTPKTTAPPVTIMPVQDLLKRLSATEHRVMERLQLNETEREVADALNRSPNTIHVHVKSIYRKLMVTSRGQLLALLA